MKISHLKIRDFSGKHVLRLCVLFLFIGFNSSLILAQNTKIVQENLANIRVDELSDQQIVNFRDKFLAQGFELANLEQEMQKQGLPSSEIQKLKLRLERIQEVSGVSELPQVENKSSKRTSPKKEEPLFENANPFAALLPKIFGSDLFNNPRLSFHCTHKIMLFI